MLFLSAREEECKQKAWMGVTLTRRMDYTCHGQAGTEEG